MARLEVLGAKHGDCLVLHHGNVKVLFDGGPPGVYNNFLKPWIARNKPADGALFFELGMVTHIDQDHIHGILGLTNDLCDALDNGESREVEFGQFWFNSFSGLTGKDLSTASVAAVVAAANAPGFDPESPNFKDNRTGAIIASVTEGHKLSNNLGKLGLGGNGVFDGLVEGRKTLQVSPGLEFDVIGPGKQRLADLRKEWDKEIPVGTIAAFADDSVPNLSSIVIMVKADGKSLLMTGDARGDDILEYLQAAGYATDGTMLLDAMKVAHHGSEHNATEDFFKALPAKCYVISADGAHGNPDSPVIDWIAQARGSEEFEFVFASPMKTKAKQEALLNQVKALQAGRNFTFRFRDKDELSTVVDL